MKQHSGNIGANYHFLFLKGYIAQIKQHKQQLHQFITAHVPEASALQFQSIPFGTQKQRLNSLFSQLKKQKWAKTVIQQMSQKLSSRSKQLYEFDSQRNYFLVQNFRQTCSEPIVKSKPLDCYNMTALFKVNINKQLRRVIWVKCLMLEKNKYQFFQFDHKLMPYNLNDELTIHLVRISQQNGMRLKQNQKDCCLRLMEYVIKKWDRIPNKSQQHLAMSVVDVFAHYTPSRIQQIGSVYVGLVELSNFYFQQNVNERLKLIHLAFELVDPPTFELIQKCYIPYSQKDQAQFNECFEHFRLTLTCAFFPPGASQFIIDQLLIKKVNKLDMYILFAMMCMIMSDDLQKYKDARMQLTDVINADNTKKTIKLDDVIDAFKVIYENVHPFHIVPKQGESVHNKLLDNLIAIDNEAKVEVSPQDGKNGSKPISLKVIDSGDKMAGFVVEDKGQVLRLGSKISKK